MPSRFRQVALIYGGAKNDARFVADRWSRQSVLGSCNERVGVQNSESQDWPALDEPGCLADFFCTSLAAGLAALGQQQDLGVSAGQQGLHPGNDSAFLPAGAGGPTGRRARAVSASQGAHARRCPSSQVVSTYGFLVWLNHATSPEDSSCCMCTCGACTLAKRQAHRLLFVFPCRGGPGPNLLRLRHSWPADLRHQ